MDHETITAEPGRVFSDGDSRDGDDRCIVAPVKTPARPDEVTAALAQLHRAWSSAGPDDWWAMRDDGKADVLTWRRVSDGGFVGVMVIATTDCPAGKTLDVLACKFAPGRYAGSIEGWLTKIGERHGCKAIRLFSRRPLKRLAEGLEVESVTYYKRIGQDVTPDPATPGQGSQGRVSSERLLAT